MACGMLLCSGSGSGSGRWVLKLKPLLPPSSTAATTAVSYRGHGRDVLHSKQNGGSTSTSHNKCHLNCFSYRRHHPHYLRCIERRKTTTSGILLVLCRAQKPGAVDEEAEEAATLTRKKALQASLWAAESAYVLWLFLLPYAPGDPVWAISSATIKDLVGLSLNFFFILPIMNSVGIHNLEAPILHPVSEGLFNFVIGWTLMFAPLLFTDCRRDRYQVSLDLLWGLQMFLTNTFLIPYMAIRLNGVDSKQSPKKPTQLGLVMINGAPVVGLIGGIVCLISILWSLFGRADGDFGGLADRWDFLVRYVRSERFAYAFLWDILLYAIFQPWLIGDNLQNIKNGRVGIVSNLRFIPVVGLMAYLLSLNTEREL